MLNFIFEHLIIECFRYILVVYIAVEHVKFMGISGHCKKLGQHDLIHTFWDAA